MDKLEAFENEAEMFYRDTGFLAPGKSEPAAGIGQLEFDRHEVRRLMKDAWNAGRRRHSDSEAVKALRGIIGCGQAHFSYLSCACFQNVVRALSSAPQEKTCGCSRCQILGQPITRAEMDAPDKDEGAKT